MTNLSFMIGGVQRRKSFASRMYKNLLRIFYFAETTIGTKGLFTRNLSGCNSQQSENEFLMAPFTYRLPRRIP